VEWLFKIGAILDPINHPLKKLYYHYVCVGAFLLRFILICVGTEDYFSFFFFLVFAYAVGPKNYCCFLTENLYPEERSRQRKWLL